MPEKRWEEGKTNPRNVFGDLVAFRTANKDKTGDKKAFAIGYVIARGDKNEEACIELLSHDWTSANINYISFAAAGYFSGIYLKKLPISVDEAVTACDIAIQQTADKLGSVFLEIEFFVDVNSNCWNETSGNTCS